MAHPDFGRSVNPFSTRGDRLCPPNYYWHPRIFRPSYGPADANLVKMDQARSNLRTFSYIHIFALLFKISSKNRKIIVNGFKLYTYFLTYMN